MDKQDWYEVGNRIGDLVQSAIDSKDFKQLNETITNTINSAVDMMQKGVVYRSEKKAYQAARENAGYSVKKTETQTGVKTSKAYKGVTYIAVGYSFTVIFGIACAVCFWLRGVADVFGLFRILASLFLMLAAGFFLMGLRGNVLNARVQRQKQYLSLMGDRDTCTLEELAAGTGKTKKYVTKDLKDMIRDGMFPNGAYIDRLETCLMTSHAAYQQYQDTAKQYEQRRKAETEAEEKRRAKTGNAAELSKEVQDILSEGKEFIAHIHEANQAIKGQVISDKLDRLENVVTRIFDQVEKDPNSAPDLHKLMSYYLPTTRKLVDAYEELDAQSVAGENIQKTKSEIEASLDTINTAFENLLDSFFQDTAWDISTDISVMNTMIAQDGLTKRDFVPGERARTVAKDVIGQGQLNKTTEGKENGNE